MFRLESNQSKPKLRRLEADRDVALGHRNGEEIAFHTGGPRERSRCDADYARIVSLKKSIFKKRAAMSFLDTTAVKHIGSLLSYEIMIPTLYLGRAGVVIGTEAERMAYLVAVRSAPFRTSNAIPFPAFLCPRIPWFRARAFQAR